MAKKAFGNAKTIYAATIEKQSATFEPSSEDEIAKPFDAENGDLFSYFSGLTAKNAFHARCLRVKTDCAVNLGINVLDGKEEAVNERLAMVNEYGQAFAEVITKVALDFETTGNGFLEVVKNRGNTIEELYHCPATLITLRPRGADSRFYYQNQGAKIRFQAYLPGIKEDNMLIHFSNYTQDSRHYGLPDWRGCVPDITLDYYAMLYNQKFFINSGIPDIAIIVEGGTFSEEVEEEVVKFFQSNFTGIDNAHKVLYLPIADQDVTVRFEKLAVDQKNRDGSFDLLRSRCRDNIISAHGVPPRLAGVSVAGALGGGGETQGQLKIFKEITIEPRQNLFELKLAPVLQEMAGAKIEFKEMDVKIQEKDSEFYPAMVMAGILTNDEAREALGYSTLEEEQTPAEAPELKLVKTLESIRKTI